MRVTIAIAKRLQIPVLNKHLSGGVCYAPRHKGVSRAYEDQYRLNMVRFREECERNVGRAPIQNCVEYNGYTAFQRWPIEILLKSPVFARTGHNHSMGDADEPIIEIHQDKLCHFHFHDAVGIQNRLVLGAGEIDLPWYLHVANQREDRIVLETKTVEGLRQSVRWIRHFRSSL